MKAGSGSSLPLKRQATAPKARRADRIAPTGHQLRAVPATPTSLLLLRKTSKPRTERRRPANRMRPIRPQRRAKTLLPTSRLHRANSSA